MKIHLLEIDDTLTIFGVVSKKRTGFDGKNVVSVNVYDLKTGKQLANTNIPRPGIGCLEIVNVDTAREFWKECIDYATSENYEIKRTESVYTAMNGRPIMMDGEIVKVMEEIATRKLNELRN